MKMDTSVEIILDYINNQDSFNSAIDKYNLSIKASEKVISKYLVSLALLNKPITNNIFMEMIEFINNNAIQQSNNVSYIDSIYLADQYNKANNYKYNLDMDKFIKYKYVIRYLLSNAEYGVILFSDSQLKTIFSVYGQWLLESTKRSLYNHISILNVFKSYINDKDLDFVVNMSLKNHGLANSIYRLFNNELNDKQKTELTALKVLNNLSR